MLTGRELIEPLLIAAPHPAGLDDDTIMREIILTRGRTSGPGGQHRNRVETQVTLAHNPTGLVAVAGERRSPADNQRVALRRLRLILAASCRAPVPLGEIGSDLWRSRNRGGRIAVNPSHRDYPTLLAEALDVLHAAGLDHKRAGLRLDVSPSQLMKLIAKDLPTLDALNRAREARGLHSIRPG